MALAQVFRPRTRGWRKAQAAIEEYLHEQEVSRRKALAQKEPAAANDNKDAHKLEAAE